MGKRDTGTKERVAGTPSWHVAGGFLHNLKVKLSYQTFSIQKCTDLFGPIVCGERKPSLMMKSLSFFFFFCYTSANFKKAVNTVGTKTLEREKTKLLTSFEVNPTFALKVIKDQQPTTTTDESR